MKTGPRYKIAKRLGASVFEKTQSQKFALKTESGKTTFKKKKGSSEFGLQLLEKQKARVTYGLGERQFKAYVKKSLAKKGSVTTDDIIKMLESRLDNVIFRLGFAKSRQASRQMVNHGHFDINGKRETIPSLQVKVGDVITIRERSKTKPIFKDIGEKLKDVKVPSWLALDVAKKTAKVQGAPKMTPAEIAFDIQAIIQFYNR